MKRPQFEDPINSVKDLVDRNITIFEYDDLFENMKDVFKQHNISEWDHVANTMVPGEGCSTNYCANKNGTYQYFIKHHLHGNNTHAFVKGYLFQTDLGVMPEKKNWWRSKKVLATTNPYDALMTSRKWILNEVNFFPSH